MRIAVLAVVLLLLAAFSQTADAQVTGSVSSGRNGSKTDQANRAEARIRQVKIDAGKYFLRGLDKLKENNRSMAREEFDRSVEVFLMSGVRIRRDEELRTCFNELIETVYRLEIPSNSHPANIRRISKVCGWTIDAGLFDFFNPARVTDGPRNGDNAGEKNDATADLRFGAEKELTIGFTDQTFEPSPLDELSQLILTPEENDVNSPESNREFEVMRVAAANRSLGFTFQMHRLVQQYLNYYKGRGRRSMEIGLYRSGFFMTLARRIFREEGIPENVAWLGQVESAWKPTARSWASAVGLWQFIPSTGSRYGLRRTAYIDERQSFEQATRASARYLKFLAARYRGNWELALAAYNCGEGNVDRAIRRAGVANFWAAYPYLPRETRNYVPNILATILIANNPVRHGFGHIRPAPRLKYDRVRVPASTRLTLVAQASDSSVRYLRYLNPELLTNQTPPKVYVLRVPAGRAGEVVGVLRRGARIKDTNARLERSAKGESWQSISKRIGVTVADLKALNPGMKVPRGKVFVPETASGVLKTASAKPSNKKGVRIVLARSGETVKKLAKRFGASAVEVARLNKLYVDSKLPKGRKVRIPAK